jgi:hypothetical protein
MSILRLVPLLLFLVSSLQASDDFDRLLRSCFTESSPELRQTLLQAGTGTETSSFAIVHLWMLSEDEKYMGTFDQAYASFRKNFPESQYSGAADYFRARLLIRNHRNIEAAEALLPLLDGSKSQTSIHAENLLQDLVVERLQIQDLETLQTESLTPAAHQFLSAQIGDRTLHKRLGVVLPLKGVDANLGQAYMNGIELALSYKDKGWEIIWLDCESDPVLAHHQLRSLSNRDDLDLLLIPGEPAYAAAACGLDSKLVVLPWYEGETLQSSHMTQLNASPATYGTAMASLALDSLHMDHLITLAPATRYGKTMVDQLMAEIHLRRPDMEVGPPQWYFPGTPDMRRQLENLAIYESAFDSLSMSILFARDDDMESLVPQLAWANPQGLILSNSPFLGAQGQQAMSSFANQLLILADWTSHFNRPSQSWLIRELELREGRTPLPSESLAFESLVLLMEAGDVAQASSNSLRSTLAKLDLPSAFGGRFIMHDNSNGHLSLYAWNGLRFRPVGGLQP